MVADLPVGDNLQDHCGTFGIEFEIDEPISVLPEDLACQERRDRYEKLRTGELGIFLMRSRPLGNIRPPPSD